MLYSAPRTEILGVFVDISLSNSFVTVVDGDHPHPVTPVIVICPLRSRDAQGLRHPSLAGSLSSGRR